ncbi:hypothetical protein C4D60_Mb02t09460 [Musa balbisiana]|uniref:N-acetyltransferase domain-containing protein n=2 Tax=Mesangiospermae TaxID=1437183 RepID=A0A4V4H2J5_MUSBA|nr:hypothetical protein C4D60_Mb02t09460 [Musa balbisiana]
MCIGQVPSISANWITFLPNNTKHRGNTSGCRPDCGTHFETHNIKTKGEGLVSPPSSSPYILTPTHAANSCAALFLVAVSSAQNAGSEVDAREPDRLDRPVTPVTLNLSFPGFCCDSKEGPGNHIMGYIMGKVEGQGESWHGHVTAVTVSSEFRRQKLAKKLMHLLEDISDKIDKAYFVDLFVRASNMPAMKMYEKLGYVIYRRVLRYYSGEEDGLDMRKALSRDVEKKSIIPLKRPITPDELEYD